MQENATIDKSWDFLVTAAELDLKKVLSAMYLIPKSRSKEEQLFSIYNFDLDGKNIVRKILSLCYKFPENVTYENFIKDIAFAFNKDISREISIEETEVALLKTFKDNILEEATEEERELIDSYNAFDYQYHDNNQKVDYPQNLVRITQLLDIDLFTNNDNDTFYNDNPLVAKCYRAVIGKHPRYLSRFSWWIRYFIVNHSDFQTVQKERIEEPFWPMIWKKIIKPILLIILYITILPILVVFTVVLVLVLLISLPRLVRLAEKEEREFEHAKNLKVSHIRSLTILTITLIYLRNKISGTNLKDCIEVIEKRNEPLSKEFVSMALAAFLYEDFYTNRVVGYVGNKTFIQVLTDMKDKITFPDYMNPILTDDIKQTLNILYRSINPERNHYYEKIYNEQLLIAEENGLRVLMVDYKFPFTRISKNTKFLKCERDIYDELNVMYLQLLMENDTEDNMEDVMINLKPGDTFDVIQVYDTDRIDAYKDYLSERGKFVVVRTEAEIDRGTILSAVSDLQHMLRTPFSKQSGYIDMIRLYEGLNDTEQYKNQVEGLINSVNHIQRIVHYYDGDFPTTIRNAEKEECDQITDLLSEYINGWESYGKRCFKTKITKGDHYQEVASIEINRDLFFTSLDAIFGNAARHGFNKTNSPDNLLEVYTDLVNYKSINMVLISVRNNGKPFADDFTIDKYIDRGRFSKSSGHLGLGGYHVYSFAKANNGYINIRNNDEWNVIIDILLPLNDQDININNEYDYDGCR